MEGVRQRLRKTWKVIFEGETDHSESTIGQKGELPDELGRRKFEGT
jgi:hypothetical protein